MPNDIEPHGCTSDSSPCNYYISRNEDKCVKSCTTDDIINGKAIAMKGTSSKCVEICEIGLFELLINNLFFFKMNLKILKIIRIEYAKNVQKKYQIVLFVKLIIIMILKLYYALHVIMIN